MLQILSCIKIVPYFLFLIHCYNKSQGYKIFNSLKQSGEYMHQQNKPSLVLIMFDTKPSYELMVASYAPFTNMV